MSTLYQSDDASSNTNPQNLKRLVCVPAALNAEIESSELTDLARAVIYRIIYRYYMSRSRCQLINQKVLDKAIKSSQRKAITNFIGESEYLQKAANGSFCKGSRCIAYEVIGIDLDAKSPVNQRQHNYGAGFVGGCVDDGYCPWDGCVSVVWKWVDFGMLDLLIVAWKKLGYDQSRFDAEWSLSQVDATDIPEDVIFEAAKARVEEKLSRTAEDYEVLPIAETYAATVDRFAERRIIGLFRKDGRIYS
ncbi:MAG: hypothetical protein WKF77_06180 [Planctomycetaceae bacterium]